MTGLIEYKIKELKKKNSENQGILYSNKPEPLEVEIHDLAGVLAGLCRAKVYFDNILNRKEVNKEVMFYSEIIYKYRSEICNTQNDSDFEKLWENKIKKEILKIHPEYILDEFEYYAVKERIKMLLNLEQEFVKGRKGVIEKKEFVKEFKDTDQSNTEFKLILKPAYCETIKDGDKIREIILHFYVSSVIRAEEYSEELADFLFWFLEDEIKKEVDNLTIRYVSIKLLEQDALQFNIVNKSKNEGEMEIFNKSWKYNQYSSCRWCWYKNVCKELLRPKDNNESEQSE